MATNKFPFSEPLDLAGQLLGAEVSIDFVSFDEIEEIHRQCVDRYGGAHGVRDEGLVRSALGRPMQIAAYEENATTSRLAAALCFGLAKNHGFVDGNKRTALFSMALFLEKNGLSLEADTADIVYMMKAISSSEVSEADLAEWIDVSTVVANTEPLPQRGRMLP